jgi:hypothetical protein
MRDSTPSWIAVNPRQRVLLDRGPKLSRVVRVYDDRLRLEFTRDTPMNREQAPHSDRLPLFRLRKFRLAILLVASSGSMPVVDPSCTCRRRTKLQ